MQICSECDHENELGVFVCVICGTSLLDETESKTIVIDTEVGPTELIVASEFVTTSLSEQSTLIIVSYKRRTGRMNLETNSKNKSVLNNARPA